MEISLENLYVDIGTYRVKTGWGFESLGCTPLFILPLGAPLGDQV